jgi:hypothetical protein
MVFVYIYLGIAGLFAAHSFFDDIDNYETGDNLVASALTGLLWPLVIIGKIMD